MKPTDEERREVAAELRKLAQESARRGDDGIDERACRVLLGPRADLLDVVEAHFTLSRLADLIKPEERTCNAVRVDVPFDRDAFPDVVEMHQIKCSECGSLLELDWRYCPQCGSWVVYENA